jgi:SAM-dependent methyltransferase
MIARKGFRVSDFATTPPARAPASGVLFQFVLLESGFARMTEVNPSLAETQPAAPASVRPIASGGATALAVVYALAIFASAFLLFQVEPLAGKFLLPWFGGTPGVWTTCLLFFQVLLFGGYAYAHFVNSWLGVRAQALLHGVLLLAACAMLPIIPNAAWKPTGHEEPIVWIVLVLAATVGVPYFVLSTTGPLLQSWFSRTHAERSPYRLYALSNAGSLLALVSFPAVFDWLFPTPVLAQLWSWSFSVFALLCLVCAFAVAAAARSFGENKRSPNSDTAGPPLGLSPGRAASAPSVPSVGTRLLWFALAMVPSVLLLATTNQVCMDVASVPFLWVVPLTLYLLSFILCFDSPRWYWRPFWMPLAVISMAGLYPVLRSGADATFAMQLATHFSVLFFCSMVCHGELVRLKPEVGQLTSFYLVVAAGGAAGGILVAVVAPLAFRGYYELHLGVFACAALMLIVLYGDPNSPLKLGRPRVVWLALMAMLGGFGAALIEVVYDGGVAGAIAVRRNFYGVLRVTDDKIPYGETSRPIRRLLNGRILHGLEYTDPDLQAVPTTYYSPESGVGLVLNQRALHGKPWRVGLVGLGTGTLAAYARPADRFRFYEINAAVVRLAHEYFHYLDHLEKQSAQATIVPGDARLSMAREDPQGFDLLVLDAFSGDAIPAHLLTVDAFAIYLRHLAPDGIIAVHISNRHFELRPVVAAIAERDKLATVAIEAEETAQGGFTSTWVLVARSTKVLEPLRAQKAALPDDPRRVLWTDDYTPLYEVLWRGTVRSFWKQVRNVFSSHHKSS